jgi:Icc-related predicted phosphoesterase
MEYFNKVAKRNNYLFVSDIHGFDQELGDQLNEIAEKSAPEIVFFIGDIVGTDYLDRLQKMFYNGVFNPTKSLLSKNPNANDTEIMDSISENGLTIRDGCREIGRFLNQLDPNFILGYPPVVAKKFTEYLHYGHFVGNLSKRIRRILKKDMESNARKMANIMSNFQQQGSMVVVIEGNWDARTPLDFYPNGQPIPTSKRNFYLKKFLKKESPKTIYFDNVGTIETDDCIFVIWPFDSAINSIPMPEIKNKNGKKIVIVSHAQFDWVAIKGNTPMTNEGKKVNDNMPLIAKDLMADTAIHRHLHNTINSDGYILPNGTFVYYLPLRSHRFIDF